ncbi:MAG TPA: ribonuclease R family protein [Polyangiales bacterium]|nr:ribonuclease R family protein [Polyangiales bacterium]
MGSREVRGRVVVHVRGFGFLELEPPDAGISAFIAPPDLNPFLEGDQVVAQLEEQAGRFSVNRLRLIERTREELFGSLVMHGKRPHLRVDRLVSNTDWPLELAPDDPLLSVQGPAPLLTAAIRGDKAVLRRRIAEADAGLERVVVRHGLRSEFSAAALAEAERAQLPELGARRDLRELPTLTIDAPVSRDLDDALSVLPAAEDGGLRLFVSIADVAALVPEGSALDLEARQRGTSVYLAGRVLPMLPHALSEQALSLLPDADRPALTVELRIDPEGHVTSVDIYESLIRSHARLDYDQVAAFLDTDAVSGIPTGVIPTLRWLRTAAARISAVRSARGGVELLREEAYIELDADSGEPTQIDPRPHTSAHNLVERLMVAANEAVARWLVERGLPGLFRVHERPSPDSVRALSAFAANFGFEAGFAPTLSPRALAAFEAAFKHSALAPALYTVLGRVLGPARYTVHPEAHFGLAAPLYAHFTSPIRRYADLSVHRLVKGYLAGRRDRFAGEPALETLAAHINRAAYRATKAETERVRSLSARLFAGRSGERFHGRIVRIQPFGLMVQLERTGVSGTIATDALPGGPFHYDRVQQVLRGEGRSYTIGEALEVQVLGASEELGRIDLGVSGEAS